MVRVEVKCDTVSIAAYLMREFGKHPKDVRITNSPTDDSFTFEPLRAGFLKVLRSPLLNYGSEVTLRLANSEAWLTVRKFVKLDDNEFVKKTDSEEGG